MPSGAYTATFAEGTVPDITAEKQGSTTVSVNEVVPVGTKAKPRREIDAT